MKCRKCEIELTEENWYPSFRSRNYYLCINCSHEDSERRYRETKARMERQAGLEPSEVKSYHKRTSKKSKKEKDPLKAILEMRKIVGLD